VVPEEHEHHQTEGGHEEEDPHDEDVLLDQIHADDVRGRGDGGAVGQHVSRVEQSLPHNDLPEDPETEGAAIGAEGDVGDEEEHEVPVVV